MTNVVAQKQDSQGLAAYETNLGGSLYDNTADDSRFVRHDRIIHHWSVVKDGTFDSFVG